MKVKMIPIDRIRILNPRHRDRKKFEVIVQSIKNLGLKKPIQVSLRSAQEAEGAGIRSGLWPGPNRGVHRAWVQRNSSIFIN